MGNRYDFPLLEILDEWFDKPFADIPEDKHEIIKRNITKNWDAWTPEDRRHVAMQMDCQHDPELRKRNESQFRVAFQRQEKQKDLVYLGGKLTRAQREGNATQNFLSSAPIILVREYQENRSFPGRPILGNLLRDQRMRKTWNALAGKVKNDRQWQRVWAHIRFAKHMSNLAKKKTHRSRKYNHDEFEQLAGAAERLARKVERCGVDHLLAYEVFPQEVMSALQVGNFRELDRHKRSGVAHRLLDCWPTVQEMLLELESRSREHAEAAMNDARPDERTTGDIDARFFAWHLGQDFKNEFDQPLYQHVANITNVALNFDDKITAGAVRNVLKRQGVVKSG